MTRRGGGCDGNSWWHTARSRTRACHQEKQESLNLVGCGQSQRGAVLSCGKLRKPFFTQPTTGAECRNGQCDSEVGNVRSYWQSGQTSDDTDERIARGTSICPLTML